MSPGDPRKSTPLLAVDTGGTFTDLLLVRGGELVALKVPSDPDDPAGPVLAGIERILARRAEPDLVIVSGSTVATNAILERKGARVVLVANAGLEDVIEIGRQDRPQLYALVGHRPPPLVAREDRIGLRGRLSHDGSVIEPLDADELRGLGERIAGAGVGAVAVVLLHSYANAEHEEAVAAALRGADRIRGDGPGHSSREGHLPHLSVSSRILPEFREFERASTTVANAYVAPVVSRYLGALEEGLGGRRIRVMGSSGGALGLRRAIEEPVHTVLSGPAGGVVAALEWGRRSGLDRLLSLDMGGTSTDVALIAGGVEHTREGRVGEVPIAVPLLDIHTVGAGGGSIARVDPGGALRVGPESAGARPGPVAYGRGGAEITVTDAHVWLGRLPDDALAGGDLPLDRERVREPLAELAWSAGITPDEVAEGIVAVADATMERALRVISIERGIDPLGFHLMAFGGAAGLHAAELADRLGLAGAIVPPHPGLFSAFGMLVAPVSRDRSRTVLASSDEPGRVEGLPALLDELEADARRDLATDGADPADVGVRRWIDARYDDQSFELRVPASDWIQEFHRAHEARFGYRRSVPVEAVTLRVRAEVPGVEVPVSGSSRGGGHERPPGAPESGGRGSTGGLRSVAWQGRRLEARLLDRVDVPGGAGIDGPAVVVEYSATTWCPPGWRIATDELGALRLSRIGS